jgi:uncharacterized RDD family membrane protein YckC
VHYEDRITIATPEGVDLELSLAGVGSRFAAGLVDLTIQTILVLAIVAVGLGLFGGGVATAAATVFAFLVFAAYDVLFEVLNAGRTPGKRLNGLRVVKADGSPITFFPSAVRNVLRVVDLLPSVYLVGVVSILVTRRNQRLGDLAAGTLVVRERQPAPPTLVPARAAAADAPWRSWDVSAVTPDEAAAVRRFLERRFELTFEARTQLAHELSSGLRAKVVGVPDTVSGEAFLEQLAAAKTARG